MIPTTIARTEINPTSNIHPATIPTGPTGPTGTVAIDTNTGVTTDYVVGHYLTMYVPDGTSLPGLNSSVTPYTGGTTGDAATTIVGSGSALSGTWRSRGASGTKAEPNDVLHRYYIVQRVS